MASLRPLTIAGITVGALATGVLAYAVYFDHRRRTDPQFRRSLRREGRREARIAKSKADAQKDAHRKFVREALARAKADAPPADLEEREKYFMENLAKGETIATEDDTIEAAVCFYKALKAYPNPPDLIGLYDKTIRKPVLDDLAEMIALDPSISSFSLSGLSAEHGVDD